MQPHHPAGVEDRANDGFPIVPDFLRAHLVSQVPTLGVGLHVGVWAEEVLAPRNGQVLDADLEHGWIHERDFPEDDERAADGAAQRTECAWLVDAERPEFLDVVRLAHQAHSPAEADDVLLFRQPILFRSS